MAQQVKTPAPEPEDLTLIPRTNDRRENQTPKKCLISFMCSTTSNRKGEIVIQEHIENKMF